MAETDAEESEQGPELVERVAAIDIAKASGMVCTRVPHEDKPGRRVQRVWNVAAASGAILELADHLICQGVTRVVMEATSTYWKPFFFLLEARGLEWWLVNARDVKNVPGRAKTDKLDSVWLAKLAERGMLRASFVPPKPVRELRDLTRSRAVLTHERNRHKQRAENLLEDAQIKLSSVISDIFDVSGRTILKALIAGERSPRAVAGLAHGTITASPKPCKSTGRRVRKAPRVHAADAAGHRRLPHRADRQAHRPDHQPPGRPVHDLGRYRRRTARSGHADAADRRRAPGRDPRGRTRHRTGHPRRDRHRYDGVPHRRSPVLLGAPVPPHLPVRPEEHLRPRGQRQPLATRSTRRGRRLRGSHRHLPRRPLPPHRQTPRPPQSPGRRRPLHPRGGLAPPERPHRPLPRPRLRLAHQERRSSP